MRLVHIVLAGMGGVALASSLAWPQSQPQIVPKPLGSIPLVLAGGTVVDVTEWGRSARDLQDSVVIVRDGRITDVGNIAEVPIPKGARVIDCTGKFLIPGLVDGFAGMSSQGEANANLYMGVTTVVASSSDHRGPIDLGAHPTPHLYLIDSIGTTDNWSFLASRPEWAAKLREGAHPVELSPEDTLHQMNDTARLGTRVLWIGWNITAANTQWIIAHAHQLGLVTYGEFISTPYRVGVEAGVDALLHMDRYDLGVIPDELQRPLVENPDGPAANTAYDYAERLPPTDPHLRAYARFWPRTMPLSCRLSASTSFRCRDIAICGRKLQPSFSTPPTCTSRRIGPRVRSFIRSRLGQSAYLPPPSAGWKIVSGKKPISLPCGCGAPTRPSSPPFLTIWPHRAHPPEAQWPASPCTPSLNCWFASGSRRARPSPRPPIITPSVWLE